MKAKTIFFIIIMLTVSQLAYAYDIEPTCAGCGRKGSHASTCPYVTTSDPDDDSHGTYTPGNDIISRTIKKIAAAAEARKARNKVEAYNLNGKGNSAYERSDWKTAVDYYRKASKLSPDDQVIRQNLKNAQTYLASEQEDIASEQKDIAYRLKKQKEKEQELAQQKQHEKDMAPALARLEKFDEEKNQFLNDPMVVDLRHLQEEQTEFEKTNAAWMEKQSKLIQQRLEEPNKWCNARYKSLMSNVPPLPDNDKKFNEIQSGDVLLIAPKKWDLGTVVNVGDIILSWDKTSDASHTVLYLKEGNGKKLFLDSQPGEGPRIISEDEFLKRYGPRGTDVATLAQPLNEKEAKQLFTAAVEMAQKNRKEIANNWFGTPLLGTNFGAWGKDNVVCSEADWALINIARKEGGIQIPPSDDWIKRKLGVEFSPTDFYNQQYFLVTPLKMPDK